MPSLSSQILETCYGLQQCAVLSQRCPRGSGSHPEIKKLSEKAQRSLVIVCNTLKVSMYFST